MKVAQSSGRDPAPGGGGATALLVILLMTLAAGGCGSSNSGGAAGQLTYSDQVQAAAADPEPESRARKLTAIGFEQGQARDLGGARSTLADAAKAVRAIEDPAERIRAAARLARAYLAINETLELRKLITTAGQEVESVTDAESKADVLVRLANSCTAAKLNGFGLDSGEAQ